MAGGRTLTGCRGRILTEQFSDAGGRPAEGGEKKLKWLRGQDSNLRPSGYEPDELPDCSTPRRIATIIG